ncbi:hypothetical protein HDU82_008256 [Entophlyctis luteolus]|nr:hypothetical protein HDU82_008256 [Entophlyctis luteolus]
MPSSLNAATGAAHAQAPPSPPRTGSDPVPASASLSFPATSDTVLPIATATAPPGSRPSLREFLTKNLFILGLAVAIGLAAAWPDLGKTGGYIHAEYSVSFVAVIVVFIISGMSLKTDILLKSLKNWKMHLVIQSISLGAIPAIGLGIGRLLQLNPSFNTLLAKGLIIATSTPTTISSNVIMTRQAGGDEAGAIANCVLGNVIGVFVSPSLIFAYVGSLASGTTLSIATTLQNLAITVIVPLIVGQIVQFAFPWVLSAVSKRVNLSLINSAMLLLLVWSVFCNTFSEHIGDQIDAGSIAAVVFLCLGCFCFFSLLSFGVSRIPWLHFSRRETVAIVRCAATKSVAMGVPMINTIYAGSPLIGIISTPLLCYHAEQLVMGTIFVGLIKRWVENEPK